MPRSSPAVKIPFRPPLLLALFFLCCRFGTTLSYAQDSPAPSLAPVPPAPIPAPTSAPAEAPAPSPATNQAVAVPPSANSTWNDQIFPVLKTYCTDCHDADSQKGGVDLASLENLPDARAALRLWWRAKEQITSGQMPPPKKDQPSAEQKQALLTWIGDNENFLRGGKIQDPGERRLRRLNRTEYATSLRDLLGIPPEVVQDFFADEGAGGEGFDNVGDTLFIPPIMAEQYLAAAEAALTEVFKNPELKQRLLSAPPAADRTPSQAFQSTLRPLLRLAFRRTPSDETLARYQKIAEARLARKASWEDAARLAVKAMLCSPDFLLLTETNQDKPFWPVTGTELATRLSLFLWSSLPDAALLDEAEAGRLADPAALEAQTRRMLADPRALALARNFAGQWLHFEKILTSADPDRSRYQFNNELRHLLYDEALAFSDHLLRGGGSLLDFLSSDYAFLNEKLALHYSIPNITGPEIRQVKLENSIRGGALGLGAILTTTALPRRTSPVLRGKWILEQLLGSPPPAPPANAGSIEEDDQKTKHPTVRQELEAHLRRDDCRACHARMDPLGFALENFDPVGRWREKLNDQPLDVSGKLPDGRSFTGPAELKQVLLTERDRFGRNFAVKLLSYALGRGIEAQDLPTLTKLETSLKDNSYQTTPLILEITRSLPFTHRRVTPIPSPAE
ncbi:MAG: Protein of unknown function (DUF1587)/Protein of unknown function (DUF1592)/Protein of unknown [Verrucomicrobiales bacterium]|nr:Protein of unknown function (DUF1587)/Protein of unknown function (DUF1592)/Protein of unknown [Verrucomicrobiales bacterium]